MFPAVVVASTNPEPIPDIGKSWQNWISRFETPSQLKGVLKFNVNTPVVDGFIDVGAYTTVDGAASNVPLSVVAVVCPILIVKLGRVPPAADVKLNPILVKLPGAKPAAWSSAAV